MYGMFPALQLLYYAVACVLANQVQFSNAD